MADPTHRAARRGPAGTVRDRQGTPNAVATTAETTLPRPFGDLPGREDRGKMGAPRRFAAVSRSEARSMGATATVTTAPRGAIDAIERLYEFREPDEVRMYLTKNPDLLDLLNEAAVKIPEFLPPDGPIVLEVVWDPEDEEGEDDELFALVPTKLEPEDVRPMMDRMRREWLIGTPGRRASRFNVGPRYH